MFKSDEDDYELEEKQEFTEYSRMKNQSEPSKDIDAKIVYQYPKGQFRFPLIPDEKNEIQKREPKIRQTNTSEKPPQMRSREHKAVSRTRTQNNDLEQKRNEGIEVKKKGPFRPTEIPSPIYGFGRPKMRRTEQADLEPIVYELSEETSAEIENKPIVDNSEVAREEVIVTPIQLGHEVEPFGYADEQTLSIDEQQVEHKQEVEEPEIRAVFEDVQEDLSPSSDKPEERPEEKPEENEEAEASVPSSRKHIPFNVIMLNQDKQKLVEKRMPLKSEEPLHVPSAPKTETYRVAEEEESDEIAYYEFPSRSLLIPSVNQEEAPEWLNEQEQLLNSTLTNFNVHAKVVNITQGPSVTRYEVQPEPGVKVNKITNLSDDIKLSLAARDIRIEAPIPGKHTIGIEVPNKKSRPVFISEIINSSEFRQSPSPLTAVLGLDIAGNPIVTDLSKMPHGLIAGATGSGKSVCINSILISLLYKANPDELKLILIDPKMVELAPYNRIPHLVSPVITDVKAATAALKWAVEEMERRYELFVHAGVRDINRFNETAKEHKRYSDMLPYIVIIIDELADLMMMSPADVEEAICRIAQKARACGIHLIIATQRPSVDVITGLIKANVPTRIAFSVSSQIDSRTIIDISGAEKLLGRGDMLFLENGSSKPVRLQGTYVSDNEIDEVVAHVRREREPEYLFEKEDLLKKAQAIEEEDELFYEACEFVVDHGSASTSSLQRRFKIGYNRAARLIDMMEQQGMISEARGSKPRDVLITEVDLESLQGTSTII